MSEIGLMELVNKAVEEAIAEKKARKPRAKKTKPESPVEVKAIESKESFPEPPVLERQQTEVLEKPKRKYTRKVKPVEVIVDKVVEGGVEEVKPEVVEEKVSESVVVEQPAEKKKRGRKPKNQVVDVIPLDEKSIAEDKERDDRIKRDIDEMMKTFGLTVADKPKPKVRKVREVKSAQSHRVDS